MSPAEMAWRAKGVLRDRVDRIRFPRIRQSADRCRWANAFDDAAPGFRVTSLPAGAWSKAGAASREAAWRDGLVRRATSIAAGRLTFFDQEEASLGDPIDWNRDVKSGVRAPLRFAPSVDYRDVRESGDCKLVWEPNRHHQWVVLGRAYRATGDARFADAIRDQWQGWLDACPFGLGMNWRSGLELGVRLINWVWALDLIQPSGRIAGRLRERVLRSVELHVWEIARKYSGGSSANNHLIGEAAGVYVACAYFRGLPQRETRLAEARKILIHELLTQSNPDGGSREQAFGYQIFVLSLYLAILSAARATDDVWPAEFWDRLQRMVSYLDEMAPNGRPLAWYGDADDGYALDLNNSPRDVATILRWASRVTSRNGQPADGPGDELECWIPEFSELSLAKATESSFNQSPTVQAQGDTDCEATAAGGCAPFAKPKPGGNPQAPLCVGFADTGYYRIGAKLEDDKSPAFLLMDCGPLGFGAIAAHGHADALSICIRAFDEDFLIDPGTYDYFTYPDWRSYFRSTRCHNTVEIDGQDQSEMLGPFLWGKRANVRMLEFTPRDDGGRIVAEHDGYARLSDPVIHRRTIDFHGRAMKCLIIDQIIARTEHEVCVYFHLGESCRVVRRDNAHLSIEAGRGALHLRMDPRLEVSTMMGSQQPKSGWVSGGYHRKSPTTTIVGRCRFLGEITLRGEVAFERRRASRAETPESVSSRSSASVA